MKSLLRTERQHRQTSLFGEIVDWMLAPFLILWPISMAIEYSLAFSVASAAYDRELRESVLALSQQVSWDRGRVQVGLRAPGMAMLQARGAEETFHQVRGLNNEIIHGERALAGVDFAIDMEPNVVYFRDDVANGRDVRVGYVFSQVSGMTGAVLVQIAETDDKRTRLASDISSAILFAQFVIVPLALLMVWFGLAKGIAPLDELRDKIRNRKPQDLSPIDPGEAPEEVRPFIESINELMRRLESSLKAQQRFVADAAHQMRTPLAGLKTQAELALRQRERRDIEHAMRQIASGADRASRMINQLLALARADSDAPPPIERVDFNELAHATTRECANRAIEKRLDLAFEGAEAAAFVEGNMVLLREMISNLVDNAISYTDPGGRVTVRVLSSREIALEVEDDGIGIAPADRELVFERFYRVLGTGRDGSGLGLAIVREIAELHHAAVTLGPAGSGHGTLVRVVFQRSRRARANLRQVA